MFRIRIHVHRINTRVRIINERLKNESKLKSAISGIIRVSMDIFWILIVLNILKLEYCV